MNFSERSGRGHITLRAFIFFSSLLVSFLSFTCVLGITFVVYTQAIEHNSLRISDEISHQISRSMSFVMTKGWKREDMLKLYNTPSHPGIPSSHSVQIYRTKIVQDLYGTTDLPHDPAVDRACRDRTEVERKTQLLLEKIYPLIADQECLTCHPNARKGDVLGAVMIRLDLEPMVTEARNKIIIFLLLLSPFPLLLAGIISRFVNRRVSRSIAHLQEKVTDVNKVSDLTRLEFSDIQPGFIEFERIFGEIGAIVDKIRSVAMDKELLEFKVLTLETYANDMIFLIARDGRIVRANDRALDAYGYHREELLQLTIRDLRAPDTLPDLGRQWAATFDEGGVIFETRHRRRDGTIFPVEVSSSRAFQGDNEEYRLSIVRDISERKNAEAHLKRQTRLYALLSRANEAIFRKTSEAEMLQAICDLTVREGDFCGVWIGQVDAGTGAIRAAAAAGDAVMREYIAGLRLSIIADDPGSRGPAGQALLSGQPYLCNDWGGDEATTLWREAASRIGISACACFPLHRRGIIAGCLNFYSREPGFFYESLTAVLVQLAEDVSYALERFDSEAKRRETEQTLADRERHFRDYFDKSLIGIAMVSTQQRWVEVNSTLCEILDYSHEEMLRITWTEITLPEDLSGDSAARDLMLGGVTDTAAGDKRFVRKDGSVVHVHVAARAIREHGVVHHFIVLIQDITNRVLAEQRLKAKSQLYALLTAVNEAIIRNDSPQALFEEVCQVALREGDFVAAWIGLLDIGSRLLQCVAYAAPVGMEEFIERLRISIDPAEPSSRGPTATAILTGVPSIRNNAAINPATAHWHDTAREFGIGSNAGLPLWQAGQIIGNLSLYARESGAFDDELIGLLSQMAQDISFALDRFAADLAREQAEAKLKKLAEDLETTVALRTNELNEANLTLERRAADSERRAREMTMVAELTDFLQSSHSLEEAYVTISDVLPRLFAGYSGGFFRISNLGEPMERVTAWGPHPLANDGLLAEECWAVRRGALHACLPGYLTPRCGHVSKKQACYVCAPISAMGRSLGVLYIGLEEQLMSRDQSVITTLVKDVADRVGLALANLELRETLRFQSIHDPLTGAYNRRFMEESLKRELHRADRADRPLSVLMLDVDHFKRINDTFGHDVGDEVLKTIVTFLKGEVRKGDLLCRFGGEEFVMILPEADLDAADRKAESLRSALEGIDHLAGTSHVGTVTCSFGVAGIPEHPVDPDLLLAVADKALYQAKEAGRNRVVIAA